MASLTHGWVGKGKYTSRGSVGWGNGKKIVGIVFLLLFPKDFLTFGKIVFNMFSQPEESMLGCGEALIMVQALQCPASWMEEREVLFCRPHTLTSCQSPWSCHTRQLVSRLSYSLLIQDWEPDACQRWQLARPLLPEVSLALYKPCLTSKTWQRWDLNPRPRRDWSLNPAPWTARPRYLSEGQFLGPTCGWTTILTTN